jgi:hypothetical protein
MLKFLNSMFNDARGIFPSPVWSVLESTHKLQSMLAVLLVRVAFAKLAAFCYIEVVCRCLV